MISVVYFTYLGLVFVMLLSQGRGWSWLGRAVGGVSRSLSHSSRQSANLMLPQLQEYIILPNNVDSHMVQSVKHLHKLRPNLQVRETCGQCEVALWTTLCDGVQLDATKLEPRFLGKHQLSELETAQSWDKMITERTDMLRRTPQLGTSSQLQRELDAAIAIVQRMAFVSRSFQYNSVYKMQSESISKGDTTPVTIADFAVQAVVLDFLHALCPADRFIAEEDSQLLRSNEEMCSKVLHIVQVATGEVWSKERLFAALDRGQWQGGGAGRVWVLDPVDGTKGFIRGEHYCIALGLLIDGKPRLSVLGCPNLSLYKVLRRVPESDIAAIPQWQRVDESSVADVSSGSIFFAASGEGSYARALDMPLGAATELSVSVVSGAAQCVLCESVEATFGNRDVTKRVASSIGLQKEYLRLDGQCKGCVVGSGAAEATLRLPPKGYVEKIWDHLPACHFIQEAGGTVTDLQGRPLDFSLGRELSPEVSGVVASNGRIHHLLLKEIESAKQSLA